MTTPESPLSEKDFIHEEYPKNPYPFWFWLVITALFAAFIWGGSYWYLGSLSKEYQNNSFLQVTNRQMSLFLWQFPEHMRVNVKNKSTYLPGFQYSNGLTLNLSTSEEYAIAPPEVLFLYHTWKRLLDINQPIRPVSPKELSEFLQVVEEWKPQNWPEAPKSYIELVKTLSSSSSKDIQKDLPKDVYTAFIGWKNFFKEGDEINKIHPTFGEMDKFLKAYPHYARPYWRNIVGTHYLQSYSSEPSKKEQTIPADELAPFLKVGLYNFLAK